MWYCSCLSIQPYSANVASIESFCTMNRVLLAMLLMQD